MLDRLKEWGLFNEQMEKHIIEYTIPQYQSVDAQRDQVGTWSAEDCNNAIQRYTNRFGRSARGNKEALRDMLKIAHYAQFAYDKLRFELAEPDVY